MLVLYRCGVDSYNAEVKTAGQAFSAQFQQCMADMQERRREYVSLQRAVCLGTVSRRHACDVLCFLSCRQLRRATALEAQLASVDAQLEAMGGAVAAGMRTPTVDAGTTPTAEQEEELASLKASVRRLWKSLHGTGVAPHHEQVEFLTQTIQVCVCVCVCVVKGCRAAYLNALTCRASRTILNLHW